jgi:hypothetical protein
MAKNITTIEDLAVMINQSFTETQKHMHTQFAALKGELTGIMTDMAEELTATHEDVRSVRTTVTMLVRSDCRVELQVTQRGRLGRV